MLHSINYYITLSHPWPTWRPPSRDMQSSLATTSCLVHPPLFKVWFRHQSLSLLFVDHVVCFLCLPCLQDSASFGCPSSVAVVPVNGHYNIIVSPSTVDFKCSRCCAVQHQACMQHGAYDYTESRISAGLVDVDMNIKVTAQL